MASSYQIFCWDLGSSLSTYSAFTPNVKSVLSENLGGILGGTQCYMGDCLLLNEWKINGKSSWYIGLGCKWLAWYKGT